MRARRDDRGSIPLAMLAMIIAGGLIATLGGVVITQTRQTGFDQDYTQSVQAADAGVQEALFRANNLGEPANCTTVAPCTGSAALGSFTWSATKVMSGVVHKGYVVESTGTVDGRTRTLRAVLDKVPRFPLAAFGDKGVELKGSNGADSYDSNSGINDTGNGQIGSNANVNFNGASTTVDKVVLYNNTDANNSCNVNGNSSACDNVTKIGPKLDLASAANMKFIDDQISLCESTSGTLLDWKASDHGGVLSPSATGVLCYNTMHFDIDTTVPSAVVVFVKKAVTFETHVKVNCSTCASGGRPIASNLIIYSAGSQDDNDSTNDTESIAIGNQSYIGAAIYAPRAACLGNPSAAQADVYGALVCGSIGRITSGNQGGWAFHYDDALGNIGSGGYTVARFDEVN